MRVKKYIIFLIAILVPLFYYKNVYEVTTIQRLIIILLFLMNISFKDEKKVIRSIENDNNV